MKVFYEEKKVNKDNDIRPQKEIMFPKQSSPYLNILIVAKKKSGKSNLVWNIVDKLCDKDTFVLVFQRTMDLDNTKKQAVKQLMQDKVINEKRYHEQYDINKKQLKDLTMNMNRMNASKSTTDDIPDEMKAQEEKQVQQPQQTNVIKMSLQDILSGKIQREQEAQNKPKKKKKLFPKKDYLYPHFCCIFDDLGAEDFKILYDLVKMNRHYRALCMYSIQNYMDMDKRARQNIDIIIIFGGQAQERLEKMWEQYSLTENFMTFKQLYDDCTSEEFSFLAIDLSGKPKFYKNLTMEYVLS